MIGNEKATTHWRKTYTVEAVRLTLDNMQRISDWLGADYSEIPDEDSKANIQRMGDIGYDGDWILKRGDQYEFIGHEDFMQEYWTHPEQLASDEKYARVFQLVCEAMVKQDKATYHGDTRGMDLVAKEITEKLLRAI